MAPLGRRLHANQAVLQYLSEYREGVFVVEKGWIMVLSVGQLMRPKHISWVPLGIIIISLTVMVKFIRWEKLIKIPERGSD